MLQTKLKLSQMKHGKSGHSALYPSLYLLRQKSDCCRRAGIFTLDGKMGGNFKCASMAGGEVADFAFGDCQKEFNPWHPGIYGAYDWHIYRGTSLFLGIWGYWQVSELISNFISTLFSGKFQNKLPILLASPI